jgi:transposase InsO family protein
MNTSKRYPVEVRERATLEWVDWFNHRRLLEYTGNIPPAEFEEMFYREKALVEGEGLKQMSLH